MTAAVLEMSYVSREEYFMEKEKLWTGNFISVTITNFLIYIVFYLLMVLIADYAVDEFHASPGMESYRISGQRVLLGRRRDTEDFG